MDIGYLALILHAHLPFVRDPQQENTLEQRWLHEAITETYLPIFLVLEKLVEDGIDFRLTFSVSPTLTSMLADPLLQSRYVAFLERSIELARKEEDRTRGDAAFHPLARMYRTSLESTYDAFVHRYQRNLLNAFRRFSEIGRVDLMATAATHGYLPLLSVNASAVSAQIQTGMEHHRRMFGRAARGFWLPECGYFPGVDAFLRRQNVWFTILETHGLTRAEERPRYGVYAPVYTPAGVAAFGRDPDSSRQVWSSTEGYPGDYDYREFYRDIGYDLDLDYVRPYVLPGDVRVDTGIKYFRITGRGDAKAPYVRERAEAKAEIHAEHFLSQRRRQLERLAGLMDRKPLIVAPYDAELFGHWWFEGPVWLDRLIRKIARGDYGFRMITLPEYLEEFPTNQTASPSLSSWGYKGFSEVWLNPGNEWIYPHLHAAAEMMEELAVARDNRNSVLGRAANQAARELLLAQSSDWPFMITGGGMKDYAASRLEDHLVEFHRLHQEIRNGTIDEPHLARIERRDNLFEHLPTADFFFSQDRDGRDQMPALIVENGRAKTRPLHIVMATPEAAPFAKTGGLADMVSSLASSLERLGQRVTLIMPAYRDVLQNGFVLNDAGFRISASSGGVPEADVLTTTFNNGVQVYFVRSDRYFDRDHLYGTPYGDYRDNAERFSFFAHAALEVLGRIDRADVLHAHDWQSALTVALLKTQPERYPVLAAMRTVLTVHNLGYQGIFPPEQWNVLGLDASLFHPQCLEFYGNINFLKAGLNFADALTTVSPSYAREIRMPEYGFGLEGVLTQRADGLTGILNGADYDLWNPTTDDYIASRYSAEDASGKRRCKSQLQRMFGLNPDPALPLVGAVTRLASQKGFDLVQQVFDCLLDRDMQFLLVGTGDAPAQDFFTAAAARHPGKFGVRIAYQEPLAHEVIAGSDMFLMPSRYEPGGLTQLYSLKYGTIPIVRATGGLKDSIEDFNAETGAGNGFRFEAYEPAALLAAVDRALATFRNKAEWSGLMHRAMTADFSWNRSARAYLELYRSLL